MRWIPCYGEGDGKAGQPHSRAQARADARGHHLTLLPSAAYCSAGTDSGPAWFSKSSSGTSMRTPTPPPGAADPNVRDSTTCAGP